MKKYLVIVIILCILYWTGDGYAEYSGEPIELFINTDPINAEVYIKGDKRGKTPLRLNDINKNKIKLRIEKQGYEPIQQEVKISGEKRKLLFYTLSSLNIQIVISEKNQNVYINEKNVGETPIEINNLPAGTYLIERKDNGISLSNKGSRDLKRTIRIETLFSAGFFGLSLAGMMYNQKEESKLAPDPMRFTSLIFGGLLGYNLLKLYKRNTGIKKNLANITAIEVERFRADSSRHYFTDGMELIGREQWDEALLKFNFLINFFPDSGYTPISVYEIGYCYYQMGSYQKAIEYFRRFVYDYPIYELFYYGVYNLIDLELSQGEAYRALADYNALKPVYLEDESGELYKDYYRILVTLYQETGESEKSILTKLYNELDSFLENNRDSSSYPDIYLLKGKLLYNYLDREEGLRILNDIKEKYNYDQSIISELESTLNGG